MSPCWANDLHANTVVTSTNVQMLLAEIICNNCFDLTICITLFVVVVVVVVVMNIQTINDLKLLRSCLDCYYNIVLFVLFRFFFSPLCLFVVVFVHILMQSLF